MDVRRIVFKVMSNDGYNCDKQELFKVLKYIEKGGIWEFLLDLKNQLFILMDCVFLICFFMNYGINCY